MGTLREALQQLDGRSPGQTVALAPQDAYAESAGEYATQDYVNATGESDTPPTIFTDSSFNRSLDLADAAIRASSQSDSDAAWPAPERAESASIAVAPLFRQSPEAPATFDPAAESRGEPPSDSRSKPIAADLLATIAVDRSYGRLWDALSATLVELPPWAIVFAGAASSAHSSQDDATPLLPAAIAFAQRNAGHVLLVDATTSRTKANARRSAAESGSDVSRRGLSEFFGLSHRFGLADVLRGTVDWRDAVEPTAVPRVALLSSGDRGILVDSTLRSVAATLIAEWKSAYQLVLIHAADARDPSIAPLAAACDGTLLLVKLGQTSRVAAEQASSALYLAGARLLGCVARD